MDNRIVQIIDTAVGGGLAGFAITFLVSAVAILIISIKKFRQKDIERQTKTVAIISLIAALGMSLFPPWRMVYKGRSIDKGYAFLFDPPKPPAVTQIDLSQLILQWAIVAIFTTVVILFIFLSKSGKKASDNTKSAGEVKGGARTSQHSSGHSTHAVTNQANNRGNNPPKGDSVGNRHLTSEKAAVKSGQPDMKALFTANPRARLVIEYSDKAQEQLKRLSALPISYIVRYVEALEKSPKLDPAKLAEKILAEHDSEKMPFQRKDLNDAFAEVSGLGESAASEFKRIVEVLGEDIDLVDVVGKLRDKFAKANFRTFPGIVYRGYTIVKLGNGMFIVRNSKGEKPAGTIEYPSERDAKEVIDWLSRDSR